MKRLISIFFVIAIVCSFGSVAFAQSTGQTFNTQTLNGQGYVDSNVQFSDDNTQNMTDEESRAIANAGLPSVSADQASSYFEKKGFELVGVLQTIAQPFSVIVFIISAFLTLVGAFGNASLVGKGLVGMMIACVMYAVVLYAPELLDFFLAWVRE